jgi:hypothetical protein
LHWGGGELNYPAQYHTIRAARQRAANTATLCGVGDRETSADRLHAPDMGFLIGGDGRGFAVSNFHRTDVSRNISISATTDFDCLACGRVHSYKGSVAAGKPLVVALSDQAFPPMLPSSRGDCVLVIRVEDGLLTEIESTFINYAFGGGLTDSGLPVGSVIMIGSVSHLGARGLGSYAEDLVKTISSVEARVGTEWKLSRWFTSRWGGCGVPESFVTPSTWTWTLGLSPRARLWRHSGMPEKSYGKQS